MADAGDSALHELAPRHEEEARALLGEVDASREEAVIGCIIVDALARKGSTVPWRPHVPPGALEVAVYLAHQRFCGEHFLIEVKGIRIERIQLAERRIVETVGDLVHILDGESPFAEAKLNRLDGKITRVLLAAEALLCRGSNDFSVHHQGRGGIVAL